MPPRIRFCQSCGAPVRYGVPAEDSRERAICTACGFVHYRNPLPVVGALPLFEQNGQDLILLCRRAIEPQKGYWTLPAGFMELGETLQEGAAREMHEEAGIEAQMGTLYTILDIISAGQVHFFFLARMTSPKLAPGEETLEEALFAPEEIPWEQLAFSSVRETLRAYLQDRPSGQFPLHCFSLDINHINESCGQKCGGLHATPHPRPSA